MHKRTHTLIGIKLIYLLPSLSFITAHMYWEITHRVCFSLCTSSGSVVVFIRWQSSLILWLYLTTFSPARFSCIPLMLIEYRKRKADKINDWRWVGCKNLRNVISLIDKRVHNIVQVLLYPIYHVFDVYILKIKSNIFSCVVFNEKRSLGIFYYFVIKSFCFVGEHRGNLSI